MSIKDITVVIATFRSEEKIKNCLNSIDKQVKVLVIENSNNLNFKENLEKEFNNVECVLAGANIGYGSANNIGLKKVKTKYALILNPDATLHSSALEKFIKVTEQIHNFAIMAPYIQEEKNKFDKIYLKNIYPIEVENGGTKPPSGGTKNKINITVPKWDSGQENKRITKDAPGFITIEGNINLDTGIIEALLNDNVIDDLNTNSGAFEAYTIIQSGKNDISIVVIDSNNDRHELNFIIVVP